ncbi:MFS transporter [Paenibacillus pinistramenti]|uniref:MFS transporter n=1 Tax=Paenibacillus pinistramenti TaxID=1768003 RepID=UPI0023B17425|nr:MFS transporter [Paenibacillus pinistramenti]
MTSWITSFWSRFGRGGSSGGPVAILISVVIVTGLSQGLLLPVLSIFMENRGIPSSVNGFHAAALYIGSFSMSIMAERILKASGFKKLLIAGLIAVTVVLPLFPLTSSLSLWFVFRLIVGMGDSAINFAAQLWLLLVTPPNQRGRIISLYGMFYGIGFSFGPLGIKLLHFGNMTPFLLLSGLFLVLVFIIMFRLENTNPVRQEHHEDKGGKRFVKVYRLAWFALIPALLYGYMEAGMSGTFPVYGLRIGMNSGDISTLLPFFGIGGLILQLPLGLLSDRIGRKKVLMGAGLAGGLLFLAAPFAGSSFWPVLILFMLAGGLVSSFFSLGLAFAADILPKSLLPAANVIASFHFNLGSMVGPNISGALMESGITSALFWLLGAGYLLFALSGIFFKSNKPETP